MKTEIKHEGIWWTFDATCDRCGKLIQDCTVSQTYEPDLQEPDFCVECIRYFLDNNIPYEIAKQQYKKVNKMERINAKDLAGNDS